MVARRTSGVSDGFAVPFFFGVGVFSGVPFFFFFPFGDASLAGDFFGFGCAVGSGVSSDAFADDLLVFDFGVASGVSLGFADTSDSSAGDFFAFVFFFGDGEVAFFFLRGEALDLGEGVGVLSRAGDSTARAFRIGLPSSSVCCA